MAPKDQTSDKPVLSDRDLKLAIIAWQCLDGDVKIQMDKFERLGGYANHNSAQANWGRLKAKLKALGKEYEQDAVATPAADGNENADPDAVKNEAIPKKKAAPRKRKATGAETGEQGVGDDGSAPTKKAAKRRPAKAKAVKSAPVEEKGGDEGETENTAAE